MNCPLNEYLSKGEKKLSLSVLCFSCNPRCLSSSLNLSDFSYALCHEACTDLEWHWEKKIIKAYFVIVILIEDWAVLVKPAPTTIL